jgi:hypothetical protein
MSQVIKNSLLENRIAANATIRRTNTLKSGLNQTYKSLAKSDVIAQRAELKKELLILEE